MSVRPFETVHMIFQTVRHFVIRRVFAFFDSGEERFEQLL